MIHPLPIIIKTLDIFNHYDRGLLNMAKAWYLKKDYRKAYYYILCCDPKSKVEDIAAFRSEVEKNSISEVRGIPKVYPGIFHQ
ncbi:MAG: hypothetical protein R2759_12640 [Bacteroidales bacterium]